MINIFVPLFAVLLFLQMANALAAQICSLDQAAVFVNEREGKRSLNVVQIGPMKTPVVVGSISTVNQSVALHKLAAHNNYVVAQFWNQIEIYDVSEPSKVRLVKQIDLKETHSSWGGGGILEDGEKIIILGTTCSAELVVKGKPSEWVLKNLEPTLELKRRTEALYNSELRLLDPDDVYANGGSPRIIQLKGKVFEVIWEVTREASSIKYDQYLHPVGSKERLLTDSRIETID